MKLHNLKGRIRGGFTTFGGVWSKGEARENRFSLKNTQGEEIPVQSRVMAYWPDGSVKWSSHVADTLLMGEEVKLSFREKSADVIEPELPVPAIRIRENGKAYEIDTGTLTMRIPKEADGHSLAEEICRKGVLLAEKAYPVFVLEHVLRHRKEGAVRQISEEEFKGRITSVEAEQKGPLQAVFCFKGYHAGGGESKMPFVIRLYLWAGSDEIRFVHTFLFDGKEEEDYLKGMGIRFDTVLAGAPYQHHIQYAQEKSVFHEAAALLFSSHPKVGYDVLEKQLSGAVWEYPEDSDAMRAAQELPVWNRYRLIQDSAYHFAVRKRTSDICCELTCKQGSRSMGAMAAAGKDGGIAACVRDFWQKYPGELEMNGLGQEKGEMTVWFYSPAAEAFDFRHYDTRSYPRTSYEGFEEVGASAYGIGVTSECTVKFTEGLMRDEELLCFAKRIGKPAVYAADSEYYHEKRAFGYWSLPHGGTGQAKWLEGQLDEAFEFYKQEVENRDWYGLFDYGDVMHSYDPVRHTWRYDTGGFAWQNTELVDTYWLWLYFMRTGREDVFTMAEAMSRHCSEVDTYHFGPLKGLGSRHNVRHWGCSCKEPRIGMAGHHRFLYYLTGDERLGDVMEDVKDADIAMSENPHSYVKLKDGSTVSGARSGPDWSSYVSNWMTHYERTMEAEYRAKIETGIKDIAAAPFGLASGPDYGYDVSSSHLIYLGEVENTPNQHLQICMGGPQIWLETADMLEDDTMKRLLAQLGEFYYLSPEEKSRLTDGKILNRPFSWPMMAAAVSGYSAMRNKNAALAKQTWDILFDGMKGEAGETRYASTAYGEQVYGNTCREIPKNSTNETSQWCLNVIMCLEFIPEYLN